MNVKDSTYWQYQKETNQLKKRDKFEVVPFFSMCGVVTEYDMPYKILRFYIRGVQESYEASVKLKKLKPGQHKVIAFQLN